MCATWIGSKVVWWCANEGQKSSTVAMCSVAAEYFFHMERDNLTFITCWQEYNNSVNWDQFLIWLRNFASHPFQQSWQLKLLAGVIMLGSLRCPGKLSRSWIELAACKWWLLPEDILYIQLTFLLLTHPASVFAWVQIQLDACQVVSFLWIYLLEQAAVYAILLHT